MTSSFDIHRQVWSLAVASGIAGGCVGTQAELQQKMDVSLQPSIDNMNIGPWKVVWGPTVWKLARDTNESAADHTNAAADWGHHVTRNTYVVAIAGTPSSSSVDCDDDVHIQEIVNFEPFGNDGAS